MESLGSVESNILPCGSKHDEQNQSDYQDDLISQLAVASSAGVAAAAAILSSKKSHHNYRFETSPAIRKRQQTRILRKIKELVDEFAGRCGQQICVVCCGSSKSTKPNSIQIFGTQPLENVLRNQKLTILADLENSLQNDVEQQQQQHQQNENRNNQYELPSLIIDGIPTSLDQMTQCQLRMFIPLLLKYSTGRGKPGWGRNECKPEWWPEELPWANIRVDPRDEEAKKKSPWTEVLKEVIRNCYKYHGREDLLYPFANNESPANKKQKFISKMANKITKLPLTKKLKYSEEMIIQKSSENNIGNEQEINENEVSTTNAFTLLQRIQNIDGSVSLVPVESGIGVVTVVDASRENEHLINDQFMNENNEMNSLNNSETKSENLTSSKTSLFNNSNLRGSPILITNETDSIGTLTSLRNSVIQMNSFPNLWNNFSTDQQQNSSASNNLSSDIQMVISSESNVGNEEHSEESDDDDNEISEQIIELACINKATRASSHFNESMDASENSSDKILQAKPKRFR